MTTTKPIPDAPAWTNDELGDVHTNDDKPAKVRRMFASIAPSYDLNNRVHSAWRDQAWRRCAVRMANVQSGDTVLDVACGTGDLTEAFGRTPASKIVGIDFTRPMLDQAERKLERLDQSRRDRISYVEGDALNLPVADASADVVSIAFGIRNVSDPERALDEMARVLRPGGRLIVLEFTRPGLAPVRWFNALYCQRIMPLTATLLSRDRSGAYRYLPASVSTFLSKEELGRLIEHRGFSDLNARSLSLGICACHCAVRGSERLRDADQT